MLSKYYHQVFNVLQKKGITCNDLKGGGFVNLRNLKYTLLIFITCLALTIFPRPSPAATWDYTISTVDTPGIIDMSGTSAVVNTTSQEILLRQAMTPDVVSFWSSGEMDYVVLTTTGVKHFSYNGTAMIENTLLNVNISSPLALTTPDPYPDVISANAGDIKHYSFSGTGMVENPALSVAGLTGVTALGSAGSSEISSLVGNQIEHFSFNGTAMIRNTVLEPQVSLNSPLDVALGSGGYNTAILEQDRVRWFNFDGSGMIENPALAVTGLSNPMAMAIADPNGGYDVAVVDGSQVKHYSFSGTNLVYNASLSVTTGLTTPKAVAIKPGSYDRIIVDGNSVKYYQWNGSSLVFNSALSVTVANIVQGAGYSASATAQSQTKDPGANSGYVRVRAAHELPNNTSVTWSVTADGVNWIKKWRVRGTATGSVLEISPDNGTAWNPVGTASDALPSANNTQLWTQLTSGRVIKWKAELATSDPAVTPKIATFPRGGVAVRIDTNAVPNPPSVVSSGVCFSTTTPNLTWGFSDPDGDVQSAYQVQIVRASDMALVMDTGKVNSGQNWYTLVTSQAPDTPGPLWSSGTYQYKYRVKVWDQAGAESSWSNYGDFCVVAFERPRIAQIVSPPLGQISPDPVNLVTHIIISQGLTAGQLPKAKAGAKVVLMVDSIGPLTSITSSFPYLSQIASVNTPVKLSDGVTNNPMYSVGNPVNRWSVEFWTDPSLTVCPSGTLVQMRLSGSSGAGATSLDTPPYSDGVVITEGSIFEDWFVVLQGRDVN